MAKKRTLCIGWTKGLQRMKAKIVNMAPVIGADQANALMGVVTAQHKGRVAAIQARNFETRHRQLIERHDHYERSLDRHLGLA